MNVSHHFSTPSKVPKIVHFLDFAIAVFTPNIGARLFCAAGRFIFEMVKVHAARFNANVAAGTVDAHSQCSGVTCPLLR